MGTEINHKICELLQNPLRDMKEVIQGDPTVATEADRQTRVGEVTL